MGQDNFVADAAFDFAKMKISKAKQKEVASLSLQADGAINELGDWFLWGHDELENLESLPSLAGCTRLRALDISLTQVSDLSGLASVPFLKHFYAGDCPLTDLNGIAHLKGLISLGIQGTQVCKINVVSQFSNLELLHLGSTDVEDMSPVSRCTELKKLFISHSKVSDITPLKPLHKLKVLSIANLKLLDCSALRFLTSLEKLHIDENQINHVLRENLPERIQIDLDVYRWNTGAIGLNSTKLGMFQKKPERAFLTELTKQD